MIRMITCEKVTSNNTNLYRKDGIQYRTKQSSNEKIEIN